jgi:hypothetical protein
MLEFQILPNKVPLYIYYFYCCGGRVEKSMYKSEVFHQEKNMVNWQTEVKREQKLHFQLFCLRQDLGIKPRLALNSQSSCLNHLCAGITGVCHHIQLQITFVHTIFLHLFYKKPYHNYIYLPLFIFCVKTLSSQAKSKE